MTEYCIYLSWSGWTPEQWAAWIQVAGSFAALFLALYVPVRMRRIEELDRMQATLSVMEELDRLSQRYIAILEDGEAPLENAPSDFRSLAEACDAHAKNPSTPALLVPVLDQTKQAAMLVKSHWDAVSMGTPRRDNPAAQEAARARRANVAKQLERARLMVAAWRKQHRLTLLWT